MMMALGFFVFDIRTAAFQELQRKTSWRHSPHHRVGKRPAYQFLGADRDTISLSGTLYPEVTSGRITLDLLRNMAETGKGWPLIEGSGRLYGFWSVTEISETDSEHVSDGTPQKIAFVIELERVDDKDTSLLGTATNAALSAATGALAGPLNNIRF